jgi:hypothetical protein
MRCRCARDAGGVVLMTMILMTVLAALGVGLISLSGTERAVAGNHQTGIQTLYAAEAIAQHVILELTADRRWSEALSGGWHSSVFAGDHPVSPWFPSTDLASLTADLQRQTDAESVWAANTPGWRLFASGTLADLTGVAADMAPALLMAWVADDEAEVDGLPVADSNGVIVVRAQALGAGGLRRSVQAVLRQEAGAPPAEGEPPPPAPPTVVRVLTWREVR